MTLTPALYCWSVTALAIVVLAAYAYSASRETRGTANMLIRNRRMGRERPGRRDRAMVPRRGIVPRRDKHGGRHLPSRRQGHVVRPHLTFPHPAAAETPRRDKPGCFQQVRLPDRNTGAGKQIGLFPKIVSRPRSAPAAARPSLCNLRRACSDGVLPTTRRRSPKRFLFKFSSGP